MEPNAAIFEHVTKMGRIGIPTSHKSEPVYRQPSYDFDDLTDTPLSTVRSIPEPRDVYVDMKLGRNMRARPKQTDDGRSNGQTSDKLDCAITEPLLPLTANSSTSAAVEFFCHMHSGMPDLGTSNISYPTNNSSSLSRTIASPQHPTQDLIESLNRQKQTRRQLEVEKEHHQAEAETKYWEIEERTLKERKQQELEDRKMEIMQRKAAVQQEKDRQPEVEKRIKQHEHIQRSLLQDSFPLADSLLRTNSPQDKKEQTSAKVIFRPLDTESQDGLTKSKNVGDIYVSGVITEKDSDEDDDFVLEKVDSSKEDSDINDF